MAHAMLCSLCYSRYHGIGCSQMTGKRAGGHCCRCELKETDLSWVLRQVPDVDIVMGCGDAPCSNLPKHELPAKPGRRRVHAAAAAGRAGIATTAAADQHAGGGGAGIRASGGRAASNDSGSAGGSSGSCQRRVNDFGSLLPGCGGCGGCSGCSGRDSSSEDSVRDGADGSEEVGSSDGSHGGGGRCLDPSDGISRRQALAVKDSGPAFPMFTYDTDAAHADIPFPDFSYWGHEFDRLWGESCDQGTLVS